MSLTVSMTHARRIHLLPTAVRFVRRPHVYEQRRHQRSYSRATVDFPKAHNAIACDNPTAALLLYLGRLATRSLAPRSVPQLVLHDLDQPFQAGHVGIPGREPPPNLTNYSSVVFRPAQHVQNLFPCTGFRQHQLERALAIQLVHIRFLEPEQRDRVCGWSFKRAAGHEFQMVEQGAINYWMEHSSAHVLDDLAKLDWRLDLDIQLPQIVSVGIVGILDD